MRANVRITRASIFFYFFFSTVETWLLFIIALHEELLGGMGERQSRAPRAVQYRDLYDPQAPADGIGNLQSLRVVHALVLHGDVLGHLPQALER